MRGSEPKLPVGHARGIVSSGGAAERAEAAEDHVSQAAAQSREQSQAEVERAREDAQAQAAKLQESARGAEAKISPWWAEMQQNWRDHTAKVSRDVETRKQEHDAARAAREAERAEADAVAAVAFASAAIEEAEYTVLDGRLARLEADEKATGQRPDGIAKWAGRSR
ncbi:hypothetical protein [Streptomyces sp. NPDC001381]|uniref:hypothetical protein n=1 Tax=Streptomyces sp. NPDC001381 TaxID=3364567 RepID=UPI00369EFDA9